MTALTLAHWGLYEVDGDGAGTSRLSPFRGDPDPSPIGLDQMSEAVQRLRVRRPAFRRGWLEGRPGARRPERRGRDEFVEIGWPEATERLAEELRRVVAERGNEAIFAGSYGWASAGRFHHAQGLLHRFLNCLGGYVRHRNSYSHAAISVMLPHVVGEFDRLLDEQTSWDVMAAHTEMFVSFGGVPLKNSQVSSGGAVFHQVRGGLAAMRDKGARIVNIGPVRGDIDAAIGAEWIPIVPNTDTALILAMAHRLVTSGRADRAFLARYTEGFDVFEAYLLGRDDGVAKDAAWAERITSVPAARIVALADEMGGRRTMLNAAWAVQRAAHGEQPYWAMIALAAILGQIGLPGGGFGLGYGAANSIGSPHGRSPGPTLPQGRNRVERFIPVARIADMLLNPGAPFDYDGKRLTYPAIDLVYWVGGNPFHHHQDLNRLVAAWRRPETVVSHEQFWTPMARMADIVLPATTTLERNDIGFSGREGHLVAMKKAAEAPGEALDDFAILARLARALGVEAEFTEGRDERGWLVALYGHWAKTLAKEGTAVPDFEAFWAGDGLLRIRPELRPSVFLGDFRADPETHRLTTPSGRIEIASQRVMGFGYDDCPGYPAWREPPEWLKGEAAARHPLHLISNQPARKLHSQLDHAPFSRAGKLHGREPLTMHPDDAAWRGLAAGAIVRVFNDRGACLAGLVLSDAVMPGVVVMATGAWFDPADWEGGRPLEKHGNPNVLTSDVGTSRLAQGTTAMTCLVEVEAFAGAAPAVTAYELPPGIAPPR